MQAQVDKQAVITIMSSIHQRLIDNRYYTLTILASTLSNKLFYPKPKTTEGW